MLQAIIGRTRQCELPGEIVHRWKNPLGYDKGQITLFGFSHNSLFYEIHVKILCNSKEKKLQMWASAQPPPLQSIWWGSVSTPGQKSLTHTHRLWCLFSIKRGQKCVCKAQGVRHTHTQTQVTASGVPALHRTRVEQLCGSTGTHRWPEQRKYPKTWLGD